MFDIEINVNYLINKLSAIKEFVIEKNLIAYSR